MLRDKWEFYLSRHNGIGSLRSQGQWQSKYFIDREFDVVCLDRQTSVKILCVFLFLIMSSTMHVIFVSTNLRLRIIVKIKFEKCFKQVNLLSYKVASVAFHHTK